MKLPHVTVEYVEEKSSALGNTSLSLILGFGAHWTFMFLVAYGAISSFRAVNHNENSWVFSTTLTAFALILLSYAFFLPTARKLFSTSQKRQRNRSIATAAVLCGMVGLLLTGTTNFAIANVISFLSAALLGAGAAVLLMSFGVSLSVCDLAPVTLTIAFSIVVSTTLTSGILLIDHWSAYVATALCFCLPIIEFLCLQHCSHKLIDNLCFDIHTIPSKTFILGASLTAPCLFLGLAIGLIRTESILVIYQSPTTAEETLAYLITGVGACLLIIGALLTKRKIEFFAFRTLVPVVALLMVLLSTPLGTNNTFAFYCISFSYLILEGCFWITFADISQKYRISAFSIFGFGAGFLTLGSLIAYQLVTTPYIASALQIVGGKMSFGLVLLTLLIIGWATLPTREMIRQSLALNLTCLSLQNDTSFYSYLVKNNISPAGQTNVVANLEQNAPLLTENSPLPKTNKEASREELPLSITNLKASKEELPLPTSCAVTSEEELPLPASCAVAPEEESPEEKMGRFKRKCMVIADTYLLSKRESEVLLLLAKGHNSSTIQKTLYISAGTANTHMRHVYAKLNVHSRQELINLIEEVDFESA